MIVSPEAPPRSFFGANIMFGCAAFVLAAQLFDGKMDGIKKTAVVLSVLVALGFGVIYVGEYYALKSDSIAYEEAEHAAKFAELLGEVITDSTKKNLEMRVEAENGATAGKFDLASRAKAAGLDAIHDTVHEMAKDEARHGKAFEGLLKRYFNK